MLWLDWNTADGKEVFPGLALLALACFYIYRRKENKYLDYLEKQEKEENK